jgi:glucokinase
LPHLGEDDVVQIGGSRPDKPALKVVLGPGTGLGMAALAPLPEGGWLALACEGGHVTLPVLTQAEFDWREKMSKPGVPFEAEDAITGGGLLHMYQVVAQQPRLNTPEEVLQAALAGTDEAAVRTLDQFVIWLARVASDAAMALQAKGGIYLAGGMVPSILGTLQSGRFREVFEQRGKIGYVIRPIPVYAVVGEFPALRGCAAAIAAMRL